ncbi:hypothetical protein E2542_SST22935 [Spatholobus suberectus]|nr:hypothetical protein E2542_SST22935 [Spatholobus suberectus]
MEQHHPHSLVTRRAAITFLRHLRHTTIVFPRRLRRAAISTSRAPPRLRLFVAHLIHYHGIKTAGEKDAQRPLSLSSRRSALAAHLCRSRRHYRICSCKRDLRGDSSDCRYHLRSSLPRAATIAEMKTHFPFLDLGFLQFSTLPYSFLA